MKKYIFLIALVILIPTFARANILDWFKGLFYKEPVITEPYEPKADSIIQNCMCLKNEPIFAGSLTATRYGGTGTNTSAWGGLLRITAGVWGTTTLTDADVPDTITVTGITTLTLNTSTITTLTVGTSTFLGTSTFNNLPIASTTNATPTEGLQFTVKNYVDANDTPGVYLQGFSVNNGEGIGIGGLIGNYFLPFGIGQGSTSQNYSGTATNSSDIWIRTYMPYTATVSNLYIVATPTESDGMTCGVFKNLVQTSVTTTLAVSSATSSDTTHSFTVVGGDFIYLKCSRGSANAPNENYWFSVKITK